MKSLLNFKLKTVTKIDVLKLKLCYNKSKYIAIKGGTTMKCKRVDLKADVQKYELGKGLEDGFELFSEIVTREWIVTDSLIRIEREDGYIVSPFILNRRGREFIGVDDYIVIDEDGTKHVCGADKIWNRYQQIEE